MWDRTQKQFDHTTVPLKAAAFWDADVGSLSFVNQGINVVYRFEAYGEGRYLKLTNAALRSRQEIAAALDFLQHLVEQNCRVCRPVAAKSGQFIEEITDQGQTYLASVVQEVAGCELGLKNTAKDVYRAWGYALGGLHLASQSYRLQDGFKFLDWRDLQAEVKEHLSTVEPEIQTLYYETAQWLETLSQDRESFGLTHADFRPGNAFWDGKKVSIIDFDEPVYHWFMADIARAMLEFDDPQQAQFLEWFIAGYREVKALDDVWLHQINWFMRMKDLDLYTWILNCWEGPEIPGGESRQGTLDKIRRRLLLS